MSKRVVTWRLDTSGVTVIDTPAWTDLLSVAVGEDGLRVWVAQPRARRDARRWTFHVIDTGEYVPEDAEHVGTAHGSWQGGSRAFHVYRRIEVLP